MSVVLAISVACLVVITALAAKRLLDPGHPGATLPCRGAPASPQNGSSPLANERCLLCNGPLLSQLATREEVVARVERRIDSDTAAVARLLANPPSADWASLFRP